MTGRLVVPARPAPSTPQRTTSRRFAIRLTSIDDLFWPFDAQPVADRFLNADVRWALLDEWDRVRLADPDHLTLVAPAAEQVLTDEAAVAAAIHASLRRSTGPLRRIDPLTRQERVAFWLGILVWFLSIAVSTLIDQVEDDVLSSAVSQGIVLVGWVALWPPASRVLTQVLPHLFNRRRFAEFADIEIRFEWVGPTA